MNKSLIAVAAAVTLTACTDAPTTPTPEFGAVERSEGPLTVLLVDAESGLQAWHGWDVVARCQTGDGNLDNLSFQIVTNPQDALRQLRKTHGDVQVSVWPIGANSCARYATETPLATGVVNFRGTDNDVSPFLRDNPRNTNAFGWMANGFVTGADGSRMRYQATYRGHWDGIDPASIVETTNISLH